MPEIPRLLAIGECMVELSPAGRGTFKMAYAGDTFNTAWYLKSALGAGSVVSYLTAVGCDPVSDGMVSFFQDAGISTDHIMQISGKSAGLYMIHLDQGERSFSYWRNTSAARGLADDPAVLANAMQDAGMIYFSGITVAILPPNGRENLFAALAAARADGRQIVFDSNLRPALWPDSQTMCRETSRAAALADIVLPSYDDEALHFGDKTPKETIVRYLSHGAGLVVVKNGAKTILAQNSAGDAFSFQPEPVQSIVDTTAAGDSFNAGFLVSLLRGQDPKTAMRAGSALSAKVIQKRGALVKT